MPEVFAGNFKRHAALGESHIKGFSDVGSIPTGSTKWTLHKHLLLQRRFCHRGVAVMST